MQWSLPLGQIRGWVGRFATDPPAHPPRAAARARSRKAPDTRWESTSAALSCRPVWHVGLERVRATRVLMPDGCLPHALFDPGSAHCHRLTNTDAELRCEVARGGWHASAQRKHARRSRLGVNRSTPGTAAASLTRMTLSRHSQVEDLASLLAVRRAQLREHALRQQAYWRLTTAVLNLPRTSRQAFSVSRQQPRAA